MLVVQRGATSAPERTSCLGESAHRAATCGASCGASWRGPRCHTPFVGPGCSPLRSSSERSALVSAWKVERTVEAIGRRQHGVSSRAQATTAGATSGVITRQVRRGRWIRLAPSVYALRAAPARWLRACKAAELSTPDGTSLLPESARMSVWGRLLVVRVRHGSRAGLHVVRGCCCSSCGEARFARWVARRACASGAAGPPAGGGRQAVATVSVSRPERSTVPGVAPVALPSVTVTTPFTSTRTTPWL